MSMSTAWLYTIILFCRVWDTQYCRTHSCCCRLAAGVPEVQYFTYEYICVYINRNTWYYWFIIVHCFRLTYQKLQDNDQTVTFEKEQTFCPCVLWAVGDHARGSCRSAHERPPSGWREWPAYRHSAGGFHFQKGSLFHPAEDLCFQSLGTEIPYSQLSETSHPRMEQKSSLNI